MDKQYHDVIITSEENNVRKLYRGLMIEKIVFYENDICIHVTSKEKIIDESIIIYKTKDLKIVIS